jgi:cytochrome c oxidase subunit 2
VAKRRGRQTGQIGGRGPWWAVLACIAGAIAAAAPGRATSTAFAQEAKAFEITASRFKFEPNVIEVREGETVRITLHSADGNHGFGIKELKVKAKIPKGGAPVTVEFKAPAAGTYEFACTDYCGSGHRDMKGKLVVAPKAP